MTKKTESIGLWLALGIVGIIAVAALPYRATTAQVENARWVAHTHRVIETIGELEQHLFAAQSARRGVALTGDAGELVAFASAVKELREAQSTVRALTADDPQQQERLDRLEPLVAACRSIQEAAIAAWRTDGFILAREADATRKVQALVGKIAPILADLVGEERRLLAKRESLVTDSVTHARWVHVLGTGVSVALICLAFATLRRENKRRRRSDVAAHVSEARFARLADSGIVGITISDLSGRFTEANDAFLEMIGYSRDELKAGKVTTTSISPAELREADQGAIRTLADTGVVALREKEYVRRDGSRVPVLVAGAMVTGEECIGFIADITDRHRVEKALRISEVRFRRLMDSGIMGIVLSDIAGNITEANEAFLSIVGYTRQDLLEGKVRGATLNTPDRERTDASARAQIEAQGFAPPWEKELVRKDGVRVPVLTGVAMLDGANSIALVVDLTERKRAQESIRQLREERAVDARFRALLEAAPDAMVIADADARIVLVNAQAERLFGYPREEMLGNPAKMLVPDRNLPEHVDRWADYFSDAPVRPMGAAMELYGLRKDGTEIPIEVRHSPLQTEQGRLVSSSIRDITERRRAEENLRQSEERYRLLVESVKDYAILMLDPDGRIATWNKGAERLKGYAADEIVGRSFAAFYPREEQERPANELRSAAAEGEIEDEGWRLRKDGSRFWANVLITAVRDASGKLVGFAKVTRDLSERRRAEQALELANRELESFSYSVAHDLRAPLRGMNGFAQVLLDTYRDKLDAEGQDSLNEILLNARKMGALIDALLSLARVTRSELKRERVDLSSIIGAAASKLAAAEPARSVDLVVPDVLWADVDAQLARALVENLLENAWKFTGKVAAPRIELGVTENGGTRAFFVRDNGAGFDMAFASKLFGAFQRLHTESEFPGTGIGLATVQRIVHRHGGRIWAEGEVDKGATFYFTLPATTMGATT